MNIVISFETSVSVKPAPRRNVAQNSNLKAVMCCNWTDGSSKQFATVQNEPTSKDRHCNKFSPTEFFESDLNYAYFDLSLNTTSAFQIGAKQICLPGSSEVIKRNETLLKRVFFSLYFSESVIFYFSSSSLRGYRNFFSSPFRNMSRGIEVF